MDDWEQPQRRGGFGVQRILAGFLAAGIIAAIIVMARWSPGRMPLRVAMADIKVFTMGLAIYHRDLGAYPPDDIAIVGGSAEHGPNEVIHYYLGRRHRVGVSLYGPYVDYGKSRLTDDDHPLGWRIGCEEVPFVAVFHCLALVAAQRPFDSVVQRRR